jgi:hypothetical protein
MCGGSGEAASKLRENREKRLGKHYVRFAGTAGLPGVALAKQGVSPARLNKSPSANLKSQA